MYSDLNDHAGAKLNEPVTATSAKELKGLFSNMLTYAGYINQSYGQYIETSWLESRLAEYSQYVEFHTLADELEKAANASDDTRSDQCPLIEKILSLDVVDDETRSICTAKLSEYKKGLEKDTLLAQIESASDLTAKIRLIRDQLLPRGDLLSVEEQLSWQNKLHAYLVQRKEESKK